MKLCSFFFECIVLGRNLKKTVSVNPSCHHVIIDPSPLKTQVLITGASAGIGKELALLLAKQGANLALFARRTSAVDTARYIYIYADFVLCRSEIHLNLLDVYLVISLCI